jgi:hypothetical protein
VATEAKIRCNSPAAFSPHVVKSDGSPRQSHQLETILLAFTTLLWFANLIGIRHQPR